MCGDGRWPPLDKSRMHTRVLQQEQYNRALAGDTVTATASEALLPVQPRLGIFCRAIEEQKFCRDAGREKGQPMKETLDARVLIIGGTGGIGRALAERYASLGSDVVITSRDAGRAATMAAEIGPNVRGIALDIAEPEKIAGMLADVGNIDRLLIVAIERDSNTVRNYDIAKARRAVTLSLVGYTEVVHTMLDRMNPDASVVIFGGLAGQRPY